MHTSTKQLEKLVDTLGMLAERHRATLLQSAAINHNLREREADRLTLLAQFSHELKKPLAVIRALAHQIKNRTLAGRIDAEVERASNTLNALITLNQLQLQKTSPAQTLAVSTLAQQIFEHFRTSYAKHHWQATITPGLLLTSPPELIFAILENLLENAAKYTPPGGSIQLAVRRCGNILQIVVADTGRGIAPAEQKLIRQTFVRAAHDTVGSGLGLPIVEQAAGNLGGDLTIVSEPGVGSTFTVSLPLVGEMSK